MVVWGEEAAQGRPPFKFGRTEWRLLGWQLAIAAPIGFFGIVAYLGSALFSELSESQQSNTAVFGLVVLTGIVWSIFWFVALILSGVRLSMVMALWPPSTGRSALERRGK